MQFPSHPITKTSGSFKSRSLPKTPASRLLSKKECEVRIEKSILLSVRRRVFDAICESEALGKNTLTLSEIEKRLSLDYLKEFVKFI